jgi:hypothetical protein
MISPQDLGACVAWTIVGHPYQVQGWYLANAAVRLFAYHRNPLGGWRFLAQGPILPPSSIYTEAQRMTPEMPSGSAPLSVGFSDRSTGFLEGDNVSLNDLALNAGVVNSTVLRIDTAPPTAAIAAPTDGATVTCTVYIVAVVSDNVGTARVWFHLDGKALGSRTTTPFQWKLGHDDDYQGPALAVHRSAGPLGQPNQVRNDQRGCAVGTMVILPHVRAAVVPWASYPRSATSRSTVDAGRRPRPTHAIWLEMLLLSSVVAVLVALRLAWSAVRGDAGPAKSEAGTAHRRSQRRSRPNLALRRPQAMARQPARRRYVT